MSGAALSGARTTSMERAATATLPLLGAALSASAAVAHLAVAQPHWREWWAHGAFFVVCAAAQALLAVLLVWRPRPWVAMGGIAGNLAVVCMYVYSRTNGSPIGPHEGVPEKPELFDLTVTAEELVLVVALVPLLGERGRRVAMHAVAAVGAGLWIARLTGVVL